MKATVTIKYEDGRKEKFEADHVEFNLECGMLETFKGLRSCKEPSAMSYFTITGYIGCVKGQPIDMTQLCPGITIAGNRFAGDKKE